LTEKNIAQQIKGTLGITE